MTLIERLREEASALEKIDRGAGNTFLDHGMMTTIRMERIDQLEEAAAELSRLQAERDELAREHANALGTAAKTNAQYKLLVDAHAKRLLQMQGVTEALQEITDEVQRLAYQPELQHMGPWVMRALAALAKARGEA